MAGELEAPNSAGEIYLSRGDEVAPARPLFTGDIFQLPAVPGLRDDGAPDAVILLQHPCAFRTDGVDLAPRLLVAEVSHGTSVTSPGQWKGSFRIMPLPAPADADAGDLGAMSAHFDRLLVMRPEELEGGFTRVACLSDVGVNLLLQRWVHHNSRVIVPTHLFAEVTAGPSAEVEITEEWIADRMAAGVTPSDAARECHTFLRAKTSGDISRQDALADPQRRSEVRRAARAEVKRLSTSS